MVSPVYPIKTACLFCSAASNIPESYINAAKELADAMKERQIGLVYGGGDWGLMGATARAVIANDGSVLGILPEFMKISAGQYHGETIFVQTMAERKSKLAEASDCFVALPGGFGTMDELSEMLTWNQFGTFAKPIGLLNVDGFWDDFVRWVQRATKDGMIKQVFTDHLYVDDDAGRLLDRLSQFVPSLDAAKFFTKA